MPAHTLCPDAHRPTARRMVSPTITPLAAGYHDMPSASRVGASGYPPRPYACDVALVFRLQRFRSTFLRVSSHRRFVDGENRVSRSKQSSMLLGQRKDGRDTPQRADGREAGRWSKSCLHSRSRAIRRPLMRPCQLHGASDRRQARIHRLVTAKHGPVGISHGCKPQELPVDPVGGGPTRPINREWLCVSQNNDDTPVDQPKQGSS